jgi:thiosulfate dehydrogenase [quinone] large subunit
MLDNAKKGMKHPGITWLIVLRVLIGWHFMYEGLAKLTNPNWTSIGYLMDSKGFLADFFMDMASNPAVVPVVDFLNIWGLMAIGLGLILGLFTRIALVSGIILLAMYYLSHPPFVGLQYALPMEGNYLVVNKVLIELVAMIVLLFYPTGRVIGIDRLVFKRKAED